MIHRDELLAEAVDADARGAVQVRLPGLPAPHWLPRFVSEPHTSYDVDPSVTDLQSGNWLLVLHGTIVVLSHEIQQSWCRQMDPVAQLSCVPSVVQMKFAPWLGTQPFSSHTSPGLLHMPFVDRGTHAPPTQTSVALAQSFVREQVFPMPEHTPVVVLQVKPSRQSAVVMHPRVHLPATQFSPSPHCDWSKHWFAEGVHTPPLPSLPAMQRSLSEQSASESQAFAVDDWQAPLTQLYP